MLNIINTQPPEPARKGDEIDIHSIWTTMQGEGPFSGMRATFVRLAGCNLMCPACDTDYTSIRIPYHTESLAEAIRGVAGEFVGESGVDGFPLVVFTGGEPFRQKIAPLVRLLIADGFLVQIETNGTQFQPLPFQEGNLTIVCSPKTSHVNPDIARQADCWKYVLDHRSVDEKDGLPLSALGMRGRPYRPDQFFPVNRIYLQPMDSQDEVTNRKNLDAVVASCMKFGYRLNLQVHKILGLK